MEVRILYALTAAFGVTMAPFAWAGEGVAGRVSEITGTVWVIPSGEGEEGKKKAVVNMDVGEGDTLVTEEESTAKVDFTDESTMKVGEKSTCVIRKKSKDAAKPTKLHLFKGTLRVKVKAERLSRKVFEVSTPTAVAGVRGTDFIVDCPRGRVTQVFVLKGLVMVKGLLRELGGAVQVKEKHFTRVRMGKAPIRPVELKDEDIKKLDASLSLAKAGDAGEKGAQTPEEKKEGETKTEEKVVEEAPAPTEGETADATGQATETTPVPISTDTLQQMAETTTTDVMTEETQEMVQEEVQEVSAERLPEPPGPPAE